jgi:hypothetical protein
MTTDLERELTSILDEACGLDWVYLYRTKDDPVWGSNGPEGFFGLQVIANSMAREFEYLVVVQEETPQPSDDEFVAKLNVLKMNSEMSFIAYFRLSANGSWHVAWSSHLDVNDVFRETIDYVQGGIILEI